MGDSDSNSEYDSMASHSDDDSSDSSSDTDSSEEKLSRIPLRAFWYKHMSNFIVINSNQMVVAPAISKKMHQNPKAIYTFDHEENTPELWLNYPAEISRTEEHNYCISYNPIRNELFLLDRNGQIAIINLGGHWNMN